MFEAKYIIVDGLAYIFPYREIHSKFAYRNFSESKPTSAGFISLNLKGKLFCYGRSVSLGLISQVGDIEIVNKTLKYEDEY